MQTLQVYCVVNNLFDKTPPIAVGGGAFGASNANGGTNAIFFDTLGRSLGAARQSSRDLVSTLARP
jgi:hypothetical protein